MEANHGRMRIELYHKCIGKKRKLSKQDKRRWSLKEWPGIAKSRRTTVGESCVKLVGRAWQV